MVEFRIRRSFMGRGKSGNRVRRMIFAAMNLAVAMAFCSHAEERGLPPKVTGFGRAKVVRSAAGADVTAAVGASWSGARFCYGKPLDLSRRARAVVSVTNLSPHILVLVMSIADGNEKKIVCRDECTLGAYGSADFPCEVLRKTRDIPVTLEGMTGYGAGDRDKLPDPSNIATINVYRREVDVEATFRVTSIRFDDCVQGISGTPPAADSFFPFCDRFGQYRHADWPGKIRSESDLAANRKAEEKWLKENAESPIRGADRFGGWTDGPQLKATGMFRVEKVAGRWWLVDPDGHLFFSHGIAGVRSGDASRVKGREKYFEWLPDGATKLVSFQAVNLARKYGEDPGRAIERDVMLRRLRAWGMNTIGNWSSSNIWMGAKFPYTDHFNTKARQIAGLKLAGCNMPDVFAPEFAENLSRAAAAAAKRSGGDPWCVGWFVDNELSWGIHTDELARTILKSPANQPARIAFAERLAAEGKTVNDALASADVLASLTEFFAERYFRSVRDAVAAVAPGRLYLGCRFCSSRANKVVMDVAAKYCDVISANMYCKRPTDCAMIAKWRVDKPHIIGEFHFGALDRGMMHASLIPSCDQDDRAAKYRDYMKDALGSSMIVGAHWFLLRDQPLTGRRDGECFQCGFLDVADTPYRELVEAARSVAAGLYRAERCD